MMTRGRVSTLKTTLMAFMQCVEELAFIDSGGRLRLYALSGLSGKCWLEFDELEIRFNDDLTPDELAQSIFLITGGSLEGNPKWGETLHHRIYYDINQPGQLGLEILKSP